MFTIIFQHNRLKTFSSFHRLGEKGDTYSVPVVKDIVAIKTAIFEKCYLGTQIKWDGIKCFITQESNEFNRYLNHQEKKSSKFKEHTLGHKIDLTSINNNPSLKKLNSTIEEIYL